MSTPPPVRLGQAAPLRSIQPPPPSQHRRPAEKEVRRSTGSSQKVIGVSVVCVLACKEMVRIMCVHYRSGTLVLHVCLVNFCEDIPLVDICLLLVVQVLLVYLGSVCSCAFIFGGVSFITLLFVRVCKWLWTIAVCMSFMMYVTVYKVVVPGVVSLFVV